MRDCTQKGLQWISQVGHGANQFRLFFSTFMSFFFFDNEFYTYKYSLIIVCLPYQENMFSESLNQGRNWELWKHIFPESAICGRLRNCYLHIVVNKST